MPTESPRILTTLEPRLHRAVKELARQEGVSLSQMVCDMVKEALELLEDSGWEAMVEERKRRPGRWLSHAEVKRRLKIR